MLATQQVVRNAKMAAGKQVFSIQIVLKGAGLSHQRVDHVSIIDRMLADPNQSRDPTSQRIGVPDFNAVDINDNVNRVTDQPAVNRVDVAFHLNRTAAADFDAA